MNSHLDTDETGSWGNYAVVQWPFNVLFMIRSVKRIRHSMFCEKCCAINQESVRLVLVIRKEFSEVRKALWEGERLPSLPVSPPEMTASTPLLPHLNKSPRLTDVSNENQFLPSRPITTLPPSAHSYRHMYIWIEDTLKLSFIHVKNQAHVNWNAY